MLKNLFKKKVEVVPELDGDVASLLQQILTELTILNDLHTYSVGKDSSQRKMVARMRGKREKKKQA